MYIANKNQKLKYFNTFNLDVKAKAIYEVSSVEDLLKIWKYAQIKGYPVLLLGRGSNVLFINDFYGIVIINSISMLKISETTKEWFIHVGAGNNWHQLIMILMKNGIYGLENMALIPGSVGAAPIQNIGAYGMEFKNVCHYVEMINLNNGEKFRLSTAECKFSYRDSVFKHQYHKNFAIISVCLKLNKLWKPTLSYADLDTLTLTLTPKKLTAEYIFHVICNIRQRKFPKLGNAGSFFKNPVVSIRIANNLKNSYHQCPEYHQSDGQIKLAAGWLIDKCNLKGYQYGGAAVHIDQALILINKNNATGKDIVNLANYIRKKVLEKFEIILEPEVCLIDKYGKVNAADTIS